MKRFSFVLVLILTLLLLTSCESLGSDNTTGFSGFDWNIFATESIIEDSPIRKTNSNSIVNTIKEETPKIVEEVDNKIVQPVVEKVNEITAAVVDKTEDVVRESQDVVRESQDVVIESQDVVKETKDVVREVSEWFEVKEETKAEIETEPENETVAETISEVVETTSKSLGNAVSDVLSSISSSAEDTVITVPAGDSTPVKESTTTPAPIEKKAEVAEKIVPEETKTPTATEIANSSLAVDQDAAEGLTSSAVMIIILIAIGLIGIAIAYYCISIKKRN